MESMDMELRRDRAALDLLEDPSFCAQWDALHAACPWATSLQHRSFSEAWYSIYAQDFEPLLVYSRNEVGQLSGLFPLAVNRRSGELVHVGEKQAEYQVWLSGAGNGDAFIEAALDRLAAQFPGRGLTLKWFPSRAPMGWLNPDRPWGKRAFSAPSPHPLMAVGPQGTVEESLRKRSNRHRLNRLGDLGPVRLEVLRSRRDLEPHFDQIVDFCNFRNAARYGCLPFQDDPLKKAFYLRLADCPEIIHASVLMAGDTLVAANIGGREANSVQIGLITQSPFASSHSPGKFLLLLLGRQLGTEGLQDLDLTPSVKLGYKDRFADHFDTAYTCRVFFRSGDATRFRVNRRAQSWGKLCFGWAKPALNLIRRWLGGARQLLRGRTLRDLPTGLVRAVRDWIQSESRWTLLQINPEEAADLQVPPGFSRDTLKDLLLYQPSRPEDPKAFDFLEEAFTRLEEGGHAFTCTEGGRLRHVAWVSPAGGTLPMPQGGSVELPRDSVLLREGYTDPTFDCEDLRLASLRARLAEAARMTRGEGRIFTCAQNQVGGPGTPSAAEKVGFRRFGELRRQVQWGRTTWTWRPL